MRYVDILKSFELEINKIDDVINKPHSDDSLYWINQAVSKFVKLRFNGDFIHKTSYEQTEKRSRDLINLYESKEYIIDDKSNQSVNYDEYAITYPDDLMFVLNEDVIIDSVNGGHEMDTCVFECTADSFMYRINNSLTDFHYRYYRARPIRIRTNDGCKLLTDKNYKVTKYTLGYLRQPEEITLDNPFSEYQDFSDNVMYEIVKIAAQMFIENKQDQRYNTISNEVNTQE